MTQDVLANIGHTPLLKLRNFDTGLCELLVKLECNNPSGSIKDRPALSMIEAAEREGKIRPGSTLVEATAGNTGLGLALVASRKGYRMLLVIPDKMSQEKIHHLRAMGAQVVITRSDVGKGHPEYYQDMAERITRETPGAYYVNQFGNPANPLAHEVSTGPELWEQVAHKLDAVVCGVGSGGTITGLSRFFARAAPHVEMVLADPVGSILVEYVKTGKFGEAGSWLVEGIGEDFVPPIADLSRVKHAYSISDEESLMTARALLEKEGILGGSSSGTLVAAALRYCKEQTVPKRVATFICDSGNKYLSKMFNDHWMADHGFLRARDQGNLQDLISRRHADHAVVTVPPTDTLLRAYSRMKMYEISQLPVLEGEKLVGILDESDLLMAVQADEKQFNRPVRDFMSTRLETVPATARVEDLTPIFAKGHVAIVMDGTRFLGLITRIDLLNHLRMKLA
jgi:cystathionine beta-synthase